MGDLNRSDDVKTEQRIGVCKSLLFCQPGIKAYVFFEKMADSMCVHDSHPAWSRSVRLLYSDAELDMGVLTLSSTLTYFTLYKWI